MEPPDIGPGLDFGDIHNATMACISHLEACLSAKPLMKDSWAESRLADLKLWASGVGALARPEASLDRRLQYQPKPRLVLTNLLRTLQDFIGACRMYALNEAGDEYPHNGGEAELDSEAASPASDIIAEGSSASWFAALGTGSRTSVSSSTNSSNATDSDTGDKADGKDSESILKEVMGDVDDAFDQLIILGYAIRKSGTAARLHRADTTFSPDVEPDFAKYLEFILLNDLSMVKEEERGNGLVTAAQRIDGAMSGLQRVTPEQRHLIVANLRRRHRFRYAEQHGRRLGQSVEYFQASPLLNLHAPENQLEIDSRSHGSQAPADRKPSPAGGSPSAIHAGADPGPFQLQQATITMPSLAEGNILEMAAPMNAPASRVSVSVARIQYPAPPPTPSHMKGFKCPCCHQTLPEMFKDWSRWRKHLVEDLCPYTCPFTDCPRPSNLYITRAAWRDHVLSIHGAGEYWECLACASTATPTAFSSAEEFLQHNRAQHKHAISEDQLLDLQHQCRRASPPMITQCPLCPWPRNVEVTPDAVSMLEHIANCIHEFSLHALPWAESPPTDLSKRLLDTDFTDPTNNAVDQQVNDWLEGVEIQAGVDMQSIDIREFFILPSPPVSQTYRRPFRPEEYFAEDFENSGVSARVASGTRSSDPDLPEAREANPTRYHGTGADPRFPPGIPIPRSRHGYTVAWICFTPEEYEAARAFLDETHKAMPNLFIKYHTLGRIGRHNVVILLVPKDRTPSITEWELTSAFPKIKLRLVVGTGSIAPEPQNDLRLGNVAVGIGRDGMAGLILFDADRTVHLWEQVTEGYGSTPPPFILQAIYGLEVHKLQRKHIEGSINAALDAHPAMRPNNQRPKASSAGTYKGSPLHVVPLHLGGQDENAVVVHTGVIATACVGITGGPLQYNTTAEGNIICFDAHLASLPKDFATLVIRGISNYTGSRLRSTWKGYAAMAAAAFTKDLLTQISPSTLRGTDLPDEDSQH